jgi:hypothetical protein
MNKRKSGRAEPKGSAGAPEAEITSKIVVTREMRREGAERLSDLLECDVDREYAVAEVFSAMAKVYLADRFGA